MLSVGDLRCVGPEMIIANLEQRVGLTIYYDISKVRDLGIIVNCRAHLFFCWKPGGIDLRTFSE